MKVTKILSGGQTGADTGGLLAAEELGIPTGGYAAKDFRTELGPNPKLGTRFHLEDTGIYNYLHRTELNVNRTDGTLIFGNVGEPGTSATRGLCRKFAKPFLVVDYQVDVIVARDWLFDHKIKWLNVAGNRESKYPGIQNASYLFVVTMLKGWNDEASY